MSTLGEPLTGDDKKLFDKILLAISTLGKPVAIERFGKGVRNLEDKWEGYHLHYYVLDILNRLKNKKLPKGVDQEKIGIALIDNGYHGELGTLQQRRL